MKYLLIGFVGFALLAFIVQGLFSGLSFFQEDRNNVVTVDGDAIKVDEYSNMVERYVEDARSKSRDGSITDIQENQLRTQVINSLVNQKLIENEAEYLGLNVGKAELTDLMIGDNPSPLLYQFFMDPNTGSIDKEAIKQQLRMVNEEDHSDDPEMRMMNQQARTAWLEMQDQIVYNQLYSKYANLISSSIVYNSLERKAAYENNKISVNFDYVQKRFATISDEGITVSDAEVKQLYEKRKAKHKQEYAKVVDYINVPLVPSQKDIETERQNMISLKEKLESSNDNIAMLVAHNSTVPYLEAYRSLESLNAEEKRFVETSTVGTVSEPMQNGTTFSMFKYIAEVNAPDTIDLQIIPLTQIFDEAKMQTEADSLLNLIKNGTSFSEIALSRSNGQFDGNYGRHTEQSFLSAENRFFDVAFKNAVFNAPLNTPQLITLQNKGAFIVQVTEKTAPVKKYNLASIYKEVKTSKETRNELYNNLSRYVSENKALDAFRDNAAEAGFMVAKDMQVTKTSAALGNIEDTRQIIQWAFNNKTGAISKIYETRDYSNLVVAAVRGEYQEGYSPYELEETSLRNELMNQKKAEKALAELEGKNFNSLEQYAQLWGAGTQSVASVSFGMESQIMGIGNEPAIYAMAPEAKVGEVTSVVGKDAIYAIYVTDKKVSEEAYNDDVQKMQMSMRQRINRPEELLKNSAEIEDNSINFPYYSN